MAGSPAPAPTPIPAPAPDASFSNARKISSVFDKHLVAEEFRRPALRVVHSKTYTDWDGLPGGLPNDPEEGLLRAQQRLSRGTGDEASVDE
jgi:hypothetical protein